jgi:hypothetical protein
MLVEKWRHKNYYLSNWKNSLTGETLNNIAIQNIETNSKLKIVKVKDSTKEQKQKKSDITFNSQIEFFFNREPESLIQKLGIEESFKDRDCFIFDESFRCENFFVPKNSKAIIHQVVKNRDGVIKHLFLCIQGSMGRSKFTKEDFEKLPISKCETFSNEFIENYLIVPKTFKSLQKFIGEQKKKFKSNKNFFNLLKKIWLDTTMSKGNTRAATMKELEEINDFEIDSEDSFKGKGYRWWENRSVRTTVVPTENEISEWEKNYSDLNPLGIKKEEHATFSEMQKICIKLIQEVCGIKNVPQEFIDNVRDYGLEPKTIHGDYMTGKQLDLNEMSKNQHHSKEKGIEFCHLDPKKGTLAENITFGSSESNRKQGGNSITELGLDLYNANRISKGLSSVTSEEYELLIIIP